MTPRRDTYFDSLTLQDQSFVDISLFSHTFYSPASTSFFLDLFNLIIFCVGTAVEQSLRCCATNRMVAGSILVNTVYCRTASRLGRSLPPGKTRYTFAGGWMGPRAVLDRCGKSRLRRDSIPGASNP